LLTVDRVLAVKTASYHKSTLIEQECSPMSTLTTSVGAVFALMYRLLQGEVFTQIDIADTLIGQDVSGTTFGDDMTLADNVG
jgi:hypothetical protein